jgi:hypothetical protein
MGEEGKGIHVYRCVCICIICLSIHINTFIDRHVYVYVGSCMGEEGKGSAESITTLYSLPSIPYPLSLTPYPLPPIPYPLSLTPYPLPPVGCYMGEEGKGSAESI